MRLQKKRLFALFLAGMMTMFLCGINAFAAHEEDFYKKLVDEFLTEFGEEEIFEDLSKENEKRKTEKEDVDDGDLDALFKRKNKVDFPPSTPQINAIPDNLCNEAVEYLYQQGITTCADAISFNSSSKIKRADLVTFLWRAAGCPPCTDIPHTFHDVLPDGPYSYAYDAILWAVENEIIAARTSTKFAPDAEMKHQEILFVLYRYDVVYLERSDTRGYLDPFVDAHLLHEYAKTAAEWATYKGILTGNVLLPTVTGTRATVAFWLYRLLTV